MHTSHTLGHRGRWVLGMAALAGAWMLVPAGCTTTADEPVGHSRTVEKRTVETPTEKTTVTETREKDTHVTPR